MTIPPEESGNARRRVSSNGAIEALPAACLYVPTRRLPAAIAAYFPFWAVEVVKAAGSSFIRSLSRDNNVPPILFIMTLT
jgi:hypothetical protein